MFQMMKKIYFIREKTSYYGGAEVYLSRLTNALKKTKIEFMEKAVLVRNKWRKKIPAVTHIDGTARVQTVNKNANPKFYDLIRAFYKITDVPVLLNTSFNLNGEPIVMSPTDAIRTFYTCGLDILVIGDYTVEK